MSIWRRAQTVLPPGVYDEIVSDALAARLAVLERTHAVKLAEVGKDTDVDEQLVRLVRDAARIAIASRGVRNTVRNSVAASPWVSNVWPNRAFVRGMGSEMRGSVRR